MLIEESASLWQEDSDGHVFGVGDKLQVGVVTPDHHLPLLEEVVPHLQQATSLPRAAGTDEEDVYAGLVETAGVDVKDLMGNS
jgi:hypothetical protein